MKLYVQTDSQNYICASSENDDLLNGLEIEVPEDFDISMQHQYRIEEGELIYAPLPEPEPEPTLNDIMEALLGVSENE